MGQTNGERSRRLAERDAQRKVKQVNIRVPEIYAVSFQVLAESLRKGLRLEGFVVRDMQTGRVRTTII